MSHWFGLPLHEVPRSMTVPSLHWGARAIFKPALGRSSYVVELLSDRMSFSPQALIDHKGRKQFVRWLDKKGLPTLRKEIYASSLGVEDQRLVIIQKDGFTLLANPLASHGYLYLIAWRNDPCPSPKNAPPDASNSTNPTT